MSPMSEVPGPITKVSQTSAIESRHSGVEEGKSGVEPVTLGAGLSVTNLRKSFSSPAGRKIAVLRGVSFAVASGEVIAIMGSSGAGKSTLLHLIGGLEAPDSGSIVLGEFQVDKASSTALASFRNTHIGFIFQFHHLLPDLTALENVALPLMIARISSREAFAQAAQSLEYIGLGSRASHPIGHLSGGEQQRVAICRALLTRPALVLADEPTGNLDTSLAEEIAEALVTYARESKTTVILATHSEKLAKLCDRILILRNGIVSEA
jgi:lipoprotein-releasing system ATP-binding protein